jgi:hypothetical protein
MRHGFASVIGFALFGLGCDQSALIPTAPSQVPSSSPTASSPVPAATYTVFGVVRAAGNVPVVGAKVLVLGQESPASVVTTDDNGSYKLLVTGAQPWAMSPLVSASKRGYFTATKFTDSNYAPISRDTQLDLELDPLVSISLGEVVQGGNFDAVCSHWGYGAGACQRFALTVPSSGTLEVKVAAANNSGDLDIVGPDGAFAAYIPYPSGLVVVKGGLTYEIRVTTAGRRAFELTTALR